MSMRISPLKLGSAGGQALKLRGWMRMRPVLAVVRVVGRECNAGNILQARIPSPVASKSIFP